MTPVTQPPSSTEVAAHGLAAGSSTGSDVTAVRALAAAARQGADDLYSVIPILGQPAGQRVLDEWVDAGVDLLQAIEAAADELAARESLP